MLHAQIDRGKEMFSSQNCLCVLVQDQPTSEMCTMTAAAVCGDAFVHLTSISSSIYVYAWTDLTYPPLNTIFPWTRRFPLCKTALSITGLRDVCSASIESCSLFHPQWSVCNQTRWLICGVLHSKCKSLKLQSTFLTQCLEIVCIKIWYRGIND